LDKSIAVCFGESFNEDASPFRLVYCALYLIGAAVIAGLGVYFYFQRIIRRIQQE